MTVKRVPNIEVIDQNNNKLNLAKLSTNSKYKDKNIVLYFYPKDNTPGCTQESKDFRDSITKFDKLNTKIIGVSRDGVDKHQKFIEKYDFPFDLIADTEGKLCEHFGVWVEKSMFGKKYMGIERSTFILNPKGEVVADWRKVKVKGHVDDVLKILSSIK